jgi:hypothetical protein
LFCKMVAPFMTGYLCISVHDFVLATFTAQHPRMGTCTTGNM